MITRQQRARVGEVSALKPRDDVAAAGGVVA
jgi:hypothetical protein